jgi:two-component system, cell cycle sensor histidine kinase and response regulator CckA
MGVAGQLRTVRVPESIAAPFAAAEEVVSRYFRLRRDDPEHGAIEIAGERYVLMRAASLSVEFFALVQELYGPGRDRDADEFARNILFDLAHAIGRSDAQNFHSRMGLEDPIARLSAGPVHFAYAGWAFVDIDPSSRPSADGDFYLLFEHPYSFEADAWLRAAKRRDFAACIMNAGYSSGWCEASFGVELVSAEVLCRARGDACCRFIMAHPDRIEARVHEYYATQGRTPAPGAESDYQIPDFFARKRVEEELRRARDDLERRVEERTAELTRSNARLVGEMEARQRAERELAQTQKLEAVGRLAGGIAHDFNNLMAVVIGNAGLLAQRLPESDPLRRLADDIGAAGQRAAQLTRQLLSFSRSQVLAPEIVALSKVVADTVGMLRNVIGEEVAVSTSLSEGAGHVEVGRGQIEQVVMNLVVNGRDAMPKGGTITIETSALEIAGADSGSLGLGAGLYARLSVADTGEGMDERVRAHMFDPYFTTKSTGSGLGLSTVYGIVRQAGGAVDVWSEPGRGSRFDVYLPRVDPAPPVVVAPSAGAAPRGAETVLLVEDRPALRVLVRRILTESGYRVLEAADPVQALQVASEHKGAIDLLLTDVIMPHMRGPELARRLGEARPSTRVLFMSGYVEGASLAGPGERPAALVPKPFTPDELTKMVREVLDSRL